MSGREILTLCVTTDQEASSECVSQQELAAVKAEVDQLHSQLHYWQNVTVNILKDHYSSIDTRGKDVSANRFTACQIMNLKIQPENVVALWGQSWSLLFSEQ